MSTIRYDKELEEFRNLMKVPSTFEEGFSFAALIGALFVALMMVPGAMYMTLMAGQGVGPAAQWVTVILFIEVARRAHKHLKRPELFILFYMAGAAMVQPFQGLIWHQFLVQSQAAIGMGVAQNIPHWYAPRDPEVLATRNFFDPAWYPAVGMVIFSTFMGRINGTILTYGLFRIASDIEKLPFPMAPIGASGIMALAEQQEEEGAGAAEKPENWRWRIFSIGGIMGLSFGAIYLALPALSSAILNQPITILPIPFVELTGKTADILPAVATGINLNMGLLITGMAMPFFAILGSFIGLVLTVIINPMLYKHQILTSWSPSDDNTPKTLFLNQLDFYFSFTIGLSLAIAAAGIWQVVRNMRAKAKLRKQQRELRVEIEAEAITPKGRGDLPAAAVIGTYILTSVSYILLSGYLIDWHPGVMKVLLFFAFIYTPVISYVTARLEGLAGQVVAIPMVREAAFILSGYTGGVAIWFLPTPIHDYGKGTVLYRQAELTGTRFWSLWKAELILVPIVMLASIFFAQFIWSLGPIPGPEFPYTEVMWEQEAANKCIMYSATLGRFSTFEQAFEWRYLVMGSGFGVAMFTIMMPLHLPILMIYGIVRGLGQTLPHQILPEIVGAVLGRYYFQRKLGKKWRPYILVVAAGFHCGMGLITVLSVGLNFLAKSVIKIPF